jgi:ribosomal protein L12E/L44/L45/RPP1/RPP2
LLCLATQFCYSAQLIAQPKGNSAEQERQGQQQQEEKQEKQEEEEEEETRQLLAIAWC